jgi:hypothetical protein
MLLHNCKIEDLGGLMWVQWAEEISVGSSNDAHWICSADSVSRDTPGLIRTFGSQIGAESHKPLNPFSLVDHREQNVDLPLTVQPECHLQMWKVAFKNSVLFNISNEIQTIIFWVVSSKSRGRRPYPGQEGDLSRISNSMTEETMNFMWSQNTGMPNLLWTWLPLSLDFS